MDRAKLPSVVLAALAALVALIAVADGCAPLRKGQSRLRDATDAGSGSGAASASGSGDASGDANDTVGVDAPHPIPVQVPPADPTGAAYAHLDARAQWWLDQKWGFVSSDKQCGLSCHTTLPYVIARSMSGETPPALENIFKVITARSANWATVPPHYDFAPKSSRDVEAAMNATAFAFNEYYRRLPSPSAEALVAFGHAWEHLGPNGDFDWMQEDLAPFENEAAHYWGTAFVGNALAHAPGRYLDGVSRDLVNGPKLATMKNYLKTAFDAQTLHSRLMGLMASAHLGAYLTMEQRQKTRAEAFAAQACDGGWTMGSLGVVKDLTNAPKGSDGYATAMVIWTLQADGVSPSDHRIQLAREWLVKHQAEDGSWTTISMNSPGALFNDTIITDASTAYAMIALHDTPIVGADRQTPGFDVKFDSDANAEVPVLNNIANAKRTCASVGYHVPSLAELQSVAAANLLKCNFAKGFIWSIDQASGGKNFKTLSFDGTPPAQAPEAKGFTVCVKAGR